MIEFRRLRRLDRLPIRLPIQPAARQVQPFSRRTLLHAARVMGPTLVALTFAGVAHAQGTMDFSGAQTLMGTFKTFAIYAGAVICFGGLIFAGIRMLVDLSGFYPWSLRRAVWCRRARMGRGLDWLLTGQSIDGGRVDRIGTDGPRVALFALEPTESNIKFLYSFIKLLLTNGGAELEPKIMM